MLLELAISSLALSAHFRPSLFSAWLALIGSALLALIWLSTALVQVPFHNQLLKGIINAQRFSL